jgi:hypothetical protein
MTGHNDWRLFQFAERCTFVLILGKGRGQGYPLTTAPYAISLEPTLPWLSQSRGYVEAPSPAGSFATLAPR